MHNIFLTNLCNNHCPYCFAGGKLKHGIADCTERDFLSLDDAHLVARFFKGKGPINFLGGEPTCHPRFREITELFLGEGFEIFLFTNGLFDTDTRRFLQSKDKVYPIFNVNEPGQYTGSGRQTVDENVRGLRRNVNSLAVTLFDTSPRCDHIVRMVEEHGIRAVKLGIAAPSDDDRNRRVSLEKRRHLARPLADLVTALSRRDVITYGECEKLKPCMVDSGTEAQVRASRWKGSLFTNQHCRRGGNIDIGPDLTVWRCYSFPASLGKKLTDFASPEEMRECSRRKYQPLLFDYFALDQCYDCEHALERHCDGGCLQRKYRNYEQRERYFHDRCYAGVFRTADGKHVLSLYESPDITELANLHGAKGPGLRATGLAEDCDLLVTDAVHHFQPLQVTLLPVAPSVRLFPDSVRVYGVWVEGEGMPMIRRWRKTLPVAGGSFLSTPVLLYETDHRNVYWREETMTAPIERRAELMIFYTARYEGEEIFRSTASHGFVWRHPAEAGEVFRMTSHVETETI
jgi:radical SAM protein with 4Fe4S-binding SPASM domain